jgi:pimeloyl-ACP methyl ester carboxylesterase
MNCFRYVPSFTAIAASLLLTAACAPPPAPSETPARDAVRSGVAEANGIELAYESYGPADREAILLIGGTGNQLIDWPIELVHDLVGRGYRVVRFDSRDVGLSTHVDSAGPPDWAAITRAGQEGRPPPLAYTLEDMAGDALGLLDALDIEKAHIVGISQGGMIAQLIAIHHPEHVLSLTSIAAGPGDPTLPLPAKPEVFASVGTPPTGDDREERIAFEVRSRQALSSPGYPTDEQTIRRQVERDFDRSFDPEGVARHQAAALVASFQDRREALRGVRVPTVVVHGAEDPLVPVQGGREVAESIPGAEFRLIPGMGHDVPVALVPTIADAIAAAAARSGDAGTN